MRVEAGLVWLSGQPLEFPQERRSPCFRHPPRRGPLPSHLSLLVDLHYAILCCQPSLEVLMVPAPQLLEMLRCPACVQEAEGLLELVGDVWLVCQELDCRRKYPIREGIPVMLIEEGDRWVNVPAADLPVPPPSA